MAAPNTVLDLDHLADRPIVRINGKEYQLLTNNTIPPLSGHRFWKCAARQQALVLAENPSEDDLAEMAALPDRMCRLVLMASDDVHCGLTDVQRMEIVEAFLQPPRQEPPAESGATTAAERSIGANKLLDSPGSTEATH